MDVRFGDTRENDLNGLKNVFQGNRSSIIGTVMKFIGIHNLGDQ